MSAISNQPRPFAPHLSHHILATNAGLGAKQPTEAEKLQASKLQTMDSATLNKLQSSFFEAAGGSSAKLPTQGAATPFSAQSPLLAMMSSFALMNKSYFSADHKENHLIQSQAHDKDVGANPTPQNGSSLYASQARGPGLLSAPMAAKAAEAVQQSHTQTQNFLANQLGRSFAAGNIAEFLGPNATFEDALAEAMMRIADKSEKETMEQIRIVERGENGGLNGFLANGARAAGGVAGATVGAYFGGPAGAAIGQDVGDRLVGGIASQYGGSSRQVQFERLKMGIQKNAELMSAISNILATMHATKKNTIGNIRG